MACIESQLTHGELKATLVASIPECTLTLGGPEQKNTLRASIVRGGLKASVVSGRLGAQVADGSFSHTAMTGSLRHSALSASLTSRAGLKGKLYGKPSVTGTLTSHSYGDVSLTAGIVEASLEGRVADSYIAVYCPINYVTSCFSLGGWNDALGWDNNKGWKD